MPINRQKTAVPLSLSSSSIVALPYRGKLQRKVSADRLDRHRWQGHKEWGMESWLKIERRTWTNQDGKKQLGRTTTVKYTTICIGKVDSMTQVEQEGGSEEEERIARMKLLSYTCSIYIKPFYSTYIYNSLVCPPGHI